MCQGIKVSVSGDDGTKTKGSHEVATKEAPKVNPLVIGPAPAAPGKGGGGLKVPGLG